MNELVPLEAEIVRIDGEYLADINDYIRLNEAHMLIESSTNDRDHLLQNAAWQIGGRVSELLKLRPCDISNNSVTIVTLKKRLCKKRRTKSGSWVALDKPNMKQKQTRRVVPIQSELMSEFMTYAYNHQLKPDDRFFDITRVRAHQIVKKAAEKAGINYKNIHLHLYRHGFAVNFLMCGGLLPNLKTLLGHESILTTMVYLRLTQQDVRNDIDKVRF
jgi:site-specific recombinase XerD